MFSELCSDFKYEIFIFTTLDRSSLPVCFIFLLIFTLETEPISIFMVTQLLL